MQARPPTHAEEEQLSAAGQVEAGCLVSHDALHSVSRRSRRGLRVARQRHRLLDQHYGR